MDRKTRALKAVSHPTRLQLLQKIGRGEVCPCTMMSCCKNASQPAVSQHLKTLIGAGLVKVRAKGTRRWYSLTAKARKMLDDISRW
jgi:DNA-binding transcriptional ArsR family regulator